MYSLINSNYNKTYNPSSRNNALSDIKRLLTCRDTGGQNKACGYLIEVLQRYKNNSEERERMVEYLLDNDITVFLCEATSNLDFSLFRSVLTCLRQLWRCRRFFDEEHSAHAMASVLRALTHYAGSGSSAAVDLCLHFLCDLLNGIATYESAPTLSNQSAYSAVQLLSCLYALVPHINTNPNAVLSSALVLHALVSYQPENLDIKGVTAKALVEVIKQWFGLLNGALNHSMLVEDGVTGMFFVVACQLGIDGLRCAKLLCEGKKATDFLQKILVDEEELNLLKQCASELTNSIQKVAIELVEFTKENQNQIETEEYSVFLKFLLNYLYENARLGLLENFCDVLFSKGYLTMLPQAQIMRKDLAVRKLSTLVLGEMLKGLAEKYLNVDTGLEETCVKDIHMGLVELQHGIEKPQSIGMQLQKSQPYSLLIYIYFYCQSSENPEEATAPLLQYLVEHILCLPKLFKPPAYIIKALWLVLAMSTISNRTLDSLEERVYLEKATDRLVTMLQPDPSIFYTHNPAILLWSFISVRIPNNIRLHVLSQWFKSEDTLPVELTSDPVVWELLLSIICQCKDSTVIQNCMYSVRLCLGESSDEARQEFATLVWSMLPGILSKALIDFEDVIDLNLCHLLDIATSLLPIDLDSTICVKTAVLLTALFCKTLPEGHVESRCHYEYVCLKLSLFLLGLANNQKDNRVLLILSTRAGFLPRVLSTCHSGDDRVACAALQLLSYVVHYFCSNQYQPKSILQIQTDLIIKALHQDSTNERGASILQLVYMVLNSGANTLVVLSYEVEEQPGLMRQCNALRALMLRIQFMLCCRESKNQSSAGWKTLSSIFKHAIVTKNDPKLVAILTSQPWTHTLVQFQLTQAQSQEFLTFTQNWLTLLNITIKKNKQEKRNHIFKQSLVMKTLMMMNKQLVIGEGDEMKELKQNILVIVKEILDESGLKLCSQNKF